MLSNSQFLQSCPESRLLKLKMQKLESQLITCLKLNIPFGSLLERDQRADPAFS